MLVAVGFERYDIKVQQKIRPANRSARGRSVKNSKNFINFVFGYQQRYFFTSKHNSFQELLIWPLRRFFPFVVFQ
jgi:hypothetical protein